VTASAARHLGCQTIVLLAGLGALAGCSSAAEPGDDTLVVVVDVASSAVSVAVDPRLTERVPGRYGTDMPWGALADQKFQITSVVGGAPGETVIVTPYICPATQGFSQRIASKWKAVELHQLFVDDGGHFQVTTDVDRPLTYDCQWSEPDVFGGESMAALSNDPLHCVDVEQAAASPIQFTGNVRGQAIGGDVTGCIATAARDGSFTENLEFKVGTLDFGVSLGHCSSGPSGPFMASYSDATGCELRLGAAATTDNDLVGFLPVSGTLNVTDLPYSYGGHVRGTMSARFAFNADWLEVSGMLDGPLIRVP
jgi:hypothetical protein